MKRPERRWDDVEVSYPLRREARLKEWVSTWRRLELPVPERMELVELRPEWLTFIVRDGDLGASQVMRLDQLELHRYPLVAVEALSQSFADALKSRAGESPAELKGEPMHEPTTWKSLREARVLAGVSLKELAKRGKNPPLSLGLAPTGWKNLEAREGSAPYWAREHYRRLGIL